MTDLNRAAASIRAEDNFSPWIYVDSDELVTLTLDGTWVATATVQYALNRDYESNSGTPSNPIDLETKTENGRWDWPGGGDWWRFGVASGDFTSGTVVGTIQGKRSER